MASDGKRSANIALRNRGSNGEYGTGPGSVEDVARVTYSLDEIEGAEIEEFDWAQTTLAIGTFLGAWFSLMLLAAKSS